MSNDAFNRNKTKEARLGHLITEPGEQNQRDAVHIAVVPVIAGDRLTPGQRVGVSPDGKRATAMKPWVGIVDPFLDESLPADSTFWLFLFQGSVNTLRHEWTHDAFPSVHDSEVKTVNDEKRIIAESRMRAFAEMDCGWTLKHLLDEAEVAIENNDWIDMGTNEGVGAYPEFMEDFSTLTGKDVSNKEAPGFSCSC